MQDWERYDLIHPNSEAVYSAIYLWHQFGVDPEFRKMLDNLYDRTLPLLDAVANSLTPGSSLNHLKFFWESIKCDITKRNFPAQTSGYVQDQSSRLRELTQTPPEPAILLSQMQEIVNAAHSWRLRCPWAAYSLLYTLGKEHQQRLSHEKYKTLDKLIPFEGIPPNVLPEYIPRWQGTDLLVHPGLLNPNSGNFAGVMMFDQEGNPDLFSGDDKPLTFFYDAGPKGYTVPDGASLEEGDALRQKYRKDYRQIQEKFKKDGMVEPKRRADLDQTIDWLFIRLKTRAGWKKLTERINSGAVTDRWGERREGRYTHSGVAKRVTPLMKLLQIEPDPETKKFRARFEESPGWDGNT